MEVLASLVILWTLTNAVLIVVFGHDATGGTAMVAEERFGPAQWWALAGHIIVGLALAKFGLTARGPINPNEPETIRPLIRAYGLWALVFAPVGLIEIAANDITQASGGQLQRVGICRALINKPDIIFGDEPTGALNSKASGEVMDLLGGVHREGTTVRLVTHDVKVASRTERVLFMTDGRIIAEKRLGGWSADGDSANAKAREAELAQWLIGLGF